MAATKTDLIGKKYGRLTVTSVYMKECGNRRRKHCICVCDCGNLTDVASESLIGGKTLSRGCYHKDRTSQASTVDLSGKRFGRLVVLERTSSVGDKKVKWLCKCDCGNTTVVTADSLRSGGTKSCGCYQADATAQRSTKHGKRHTRVYGIYCEIKKRCYNEKSRGYKHYGSKGIRMCDEWLENFESFYDWAMTHGYRDDLTIDRIDSKGMYEPSNCQWITRSENTRRRNIEYWTERKRENVGQD